MSQRPSNSELESASGLLGPIDRQPDGTLALLLFKCPSCGRLQLGLGSPDCSCGGSMQRVVTKGSEPTVYSSTIVRHPPPGREGPFAPYAIGLVNVAEDILVLARIESRGGAIDIGDPCSLRELPLEYAGTPAVGFCFEVTARD